MAAQVSSSNSDILITKDLLGNLSKAKADLEFKATGKTEAQKFSSPPSSTSPKSPLSDGKNKHPLPSFLRDSKLQDLNFPPPNLFDEMTTSLDLKLQSCSTPSRYQSVCTLDKVKYALERAEKGTIKKRSSSQSPPSPPPTRSSSSSSTPKMFAAACPGCLLYVIASSTNPRCPRCDSFVPSSLPMKKPRLDLNASF
ncbi:hypothetical protein HRI_003032600 [Hibiscus trionum]|uniref:GIR1-like zinc ribbon domain-containing protein n=1 Tax=Hibiscus trionum TaxID=183268 RepID=A0A9W7M9W1_HIBTR|nr:hypothetical protein HRI_003032600 [Hibiscus trionum]